MQGMTTRGLLVLVLTGCGVPDYSAFPATTCGLHFEGVDRAEVQLVEDTIVETFQASLDPSLHGVCAALNGWKLTVTSAPIIPGSNVIEGVDPTAPVSGDAESSSMEIRVFSAHFILAHEAAHVAQGCSDASAHHEDWNNACGLDICVCTDGHDSTGGWCKPGLVQPQLIEVRSKLDAVLGDQL